MPIMKSHEIMKITQPTGLSGRGLLDMQSTPTGDLAHGVKEKKKNYANWQQHIYSYRKKYT